MVNKEDLKNIISQILSDEKDAFEDSDIFLVEAKVSSDKRISIFIDSVEGVKISDCAKLSKHIEDKLDRENDDYELIVSSAGLDQPLKVVEQYKKNIGKSIKLLISDGTKYKGVLSEVSDKGIVLTEDIKKAKNKKDPEKETQIKFDYDQIKEAKVIITF